MKARKQLRLHPPPRPPHALLQWGRADEGAETAAGGSGKGLARRFNGAAPMKARKRHVPAGGTIFGQELQWGRADEGAETTRAASASPRPSSFNGAAPMKARKRDWDGWAWVWLCDRLQWGRADEGAETLTLPDSTVIGELGLQWGRADEGAETGEDIGGNIVEHLLLQWGRADEGAETAWSRAWNTPRRTSFNGAAPMKARKLASPGQFDVIFGLLQWGRADEGAETRLSLGRGAALSPQLQWGRADEGAETN